MSMAREGHLRKLDRRNWPAFLSRVLPATVWQTFWNGIGPESDPRTRWNAKLLVLAWVMMGWSLQRQLGERCREAIELLGRLYPHRRRAGRTYPGLFKATHRKGVAACQSFWKSVRGTFALRLSDQWNWWGWTVLAVDGSRIDAPRTRRNERSLRRAGRHKTGPQWYVTWMVHLPTRLIWNWRQGPGNSSERSHLREMLDDLPDRPLLVADIGFGGYELLTELTARGIAFLIRCSSGSRLLVSGSRTQIERHGEQARALLWPDKQARQEPLCLRLIVLKRAGRRVYLITNVMQSPWLSRSMAGQMYAARWGVEVRYRDLKQTMERRKVLAKTPGIGAVELAGSIMALGLLLLQAALASAGRMHRISLAKALQLIRRITEAVRMQRSTHVLMRAWSNAVLDDYRRTARKHRPEWPRKKTEPLPKPPKLRRLSAFAIDCLSAVSINWEPEHG
jgi:Transposase DDE domain